MSIFIVMQVVKLSARSCWNRNTLIYSTMKETHFPQTPVFIPTISKSININSSENDLARAAHEIEGL